MSTLKDDFPILKDITKISTLEYIAKKFDLNLFQRDMPIEIEKINRTIMAKTLYELGLIVGAEIGTAQGYHAELLCKNIPGVELYCVDVWQPYAGYIEYVDRIDRYFIEAKTRLAKYDTHIIQKLSMDAVHDFEDNSLDFVYIDGAHDFKNVAMDLCEWSKKVRPGGVVFGHDYKRNARPRKPRFVVHVKDVVQAYMYSHDIKPWFALGGKSRHSDGMFNEGGQSWMFVRQEGDAI